ncbi:restriction endonuclease [Priestia filamentosa]|uniref:Methyltransferase n=1 Tax=Priestia filamentosa TaxID=1402861 RepID=A0A0H4KD02_9BACI|nr:site-specific DNA-methyltransferase [Priestia filamentosa]AKO91997.1 restriction endonuclease [Priestia filamentosa]
MTKQLLGTLELDRVYQMNCLNGMKLISDNSVDLTVTSPPYDNLRKYNGYSFDFESVANELYRITRNGGIVVWVVNDSTVKGSESGTSFKQALFFKEVGFNLHDTMIYAKTNPMPLTHSRYEQQFEYMFVLAKGKPNTFNPLLKENKDFGKIKGGTFRHTGEETQAKHKKKETKKEGYRNNIWFYSVGRGGTTNDKFAFKHPAMFPERLAEDHILSWSNEEDVVFDPFMGSGTTAKMALLNNRRYIGFEISEEYIEIANKRLDNIELQIT